MVALGLILLITILLIVDGSLYPFHFHTGPARPVWALLHSWPAAINRFEVRDIAINILIYLPVGLFGTLWVGKHKPRSTTLVLTMLLALALSISMEFLQLFDDSRDASISDIVTNVTGAALGIFLARLYGRTLLRIFTGPDLRALVQPSGAMLLVFSLLIYQIYPFFPQVGLYPIRAKLAALGSNLTPPVVPAIGAVADWLAVAQLLEVIAGPNSALLLLPLIMVLIPARLLIVGRTFTWAEIAGAICACTIWSTWLRRHTKRAVLLAWLAASLLLLRGLAPYHWDARIHPFCWTPFRSFFDSNWNSAGLVFLNKTFLYGTAVWLFHNAGYSYLRSALGLTALLMAIESVQMFLPGRTPEITDPVLIVILAVVLSLLDSSDRLAACKAGIAQAPVHEPLG